MGKRNVPLDLAKAIKEMEGKPVTKEGDECRRLIEMAQNYEKPSASNKMLMIDDAARMLGVTPQTLRKWEKQGKVCPAARTAKGHRRYTTEQIQEIKKQQINAKEFLFSEVTPNDMLLMAQKLFRDFDPFEMINVLIRTDTVTGRVHVFIDSLDGLHSTFKSFSVKE